MFSDMLAGSAIRREALLGNLCRDCSLKTVQTPEDQTQKDG